MSPTRLISSNTRSYDRGGCRLQAQPSKSNSDSDESYSNADAGSGAELTSDADWFTQTSDSLHISRKLFHTTGGLILAGFRVTLTQERFLFFFGWLLTLTFIIEFLRLNNFRPVRKMVHTVFHSLMRKNEKTRFTTTSYYQLGVVIVCALFSLPVALLGILTLAVGDPIASFSGRMASLTLPAGPVRSVLCAKLVGSKSVAGFSAFILATFLSNTAALCWLSAKGLLESLSVGSIAVMALAASVAGALAELWTNEKLILNWKRLPLAMDDNLLIPVAASSAASLVATFLLPLPLP